MSRASCSTMVLIGVLALAPARSFGLDLDGYLNQVTQKHRGLEALRMSTQGAEQTRVGGDLELTPKFEMQGSYLSDKKQPGMMGSRETRNESYSATLSKKFSTGTEMGFKAQTVGQELVGLDPALLAVFPQGPRFAQGGLGITLSQSLWKNAFGRSTDLRREREALTADSETQGFDLQSRRILADAESVFWDYAYLKEEVKAREESLARGKRLESWFRKRQADGVSDRADLLNAEALVASRELELITSKDILKNAEKRVRDFLELKDGEALPDIEGQIAQTRNLKQLVGGDGQVVQLESYVKSLEAKTSSVAAREAEEGTKADLTLTGSYFTNSVEQGGGAWDGTRNWTRTDIPTAQVGIKWVYTFESEAKESVRSAARSKAYSSQLKYERAARESATAWSEALRRHEELSAQIQAAETLQKIQLDLSKAQQEKYARGRAITSELITSEQNAAEAELRLIKMRGEQRKLEAQARLFVVVKE